MLRTMGIGRQSGGSTNFNQISTMLFTSLLRFGTGQKQFYIGFGTEMGGQLATVGTDNGLMDIVRWRKILGRLTVIVTVHKILPGRDSIFHSIAECTRKSLPWKVKSKKDGGQNILGIAHKDSTSHYSFVIRSRASLAGHNRHIANALDTLKHIGGDISKLFIQDWLAWRLSLIDLDSVSVANFLNGVGGNRIAAVGKGCIGQSQVHGSGLRSQGQLQIDRKS